MTSPRVTVVVPTFHRPAAVRAAVRSALDQTFRDIEVVVVVDGRDATTVEALGEFDDRRLRVVVPPRRLGNADARNLGVRMARAEWVALLDDDDLWMPGKIAAQLRAGAATTVPHPILSCRMVGRTATRDFVWPRRRPRGDEPVGDYIFCRRTPFAGEGIVQTSTVMARRELMERVPFASGMRRYVDLDWLLRAAGVPGAELVFVSEEEPLSIWNMEEERPRISNGADGAYTFDWARRHRSCLTPRAYAAFLLTIASANAARSGDGRAFVRLAVEAVRHGRPSAGEAVAHAANFLAGGRTRARAAAAFAACTRSRAA